MKIGGCFAEVYIYFFSWGVVDTEITISRGTGDGDGGFAPIIISSGIIVHSGLQGGGWWVR